MCLVGVCAWGGLLDLAGYDFSESGDGKFSSGRIGAVAWGGASLAGLDGGSIALIGGGTFSGWRCGALFGGGMFPGCPGPLLITLGPNHWWLHWSLVPHLLQSRWWSVNHMWLFVGYHQIMSVSSVHSSLCSCFYNEWVRLVMFPLELCWFPAFWSPYSDSIVWFEFSLSVGRWWYSLLRTLLSGLGSRHILTSPFFLGVHTRTLSHSVLFGWGNHTLFHQFYQFFFDFWFEITVDSSDWRCYWHAWRIHFKVSCAGECSYFSIKDIWKSLSVEFVAMVFTCSKFCSFTDTKPIARHAFRLNRGERSWDTMMKRTGYRVLVFLFVTFRMPSPRG